MPGYIIVRKGLAARYVEAGLPGAARLASAFKARSIKSARAKAERLAQSTGKDYTVYDARGGRRLFDTATAKRNPQLPKGKWVRARVRRLANGSVHVHVIGKAHAKRRRVTKSRTRRRKR